MTSTLLTNIGELVTNDPHREGLLGAIEAAALVVEGDRVAEASGGVATTTSSCHRRTTACRAWGGADAQSASPSASCSQRPLTTSKPPARRSTPARNGPSPSAKATLA